MSTFITDTVDAWKSRTLHSADLPLETACSSIGTKKQLFEAKKINAVEWVLCRAGENTPAIFSYAAVFGSCDPIETGNFVPNGEKVLGIESDRAEPYASYKCSYSYSFDTSADPGLYIAQTKLDGYMQTVPGFNLPVQKPRRTWQSAYNAGSSHRFWMRVPMFLRLRMGEQKIPPPEHLHEWVKAADTESRSYRANPARPNVMALEGQRIRRVEDCQPDRLLRGDAVAFTFSVTYIEGKSDWYPVFTPVDIVRVASIQSAWSSNATASPLVVLNNVRPALEEGQLIVDDNASDADTEIVGVPVVHVGSISSRRDVVRNTFASKRAADQQQEDGQIKLESPLPTSGDIPTTPETPRYTIRTTHSAHETQQSISTAPRVELGIRQATFETPIVNSETAQDARKTQQPVPTTPRVELEIRQATLETPRAASETAQDIPETPQIVFGNMQPASENAETTRDVPPSTLEGPRVVSDSVGIAINATQLASETAQSAVETSQSVLESASVTPEATQSTLENPQPAIISPHSVFASSQSTEKTSTPTPKPEQFVFGVTSSTSGDGRSAPEATTPDNVATKDIDRTGKPTIKIRKLTFEEVFGEEDDEEDESSESSTESSATTDSAGSSRWSDATVDQGDSAGSSRWSDVAVEKGTAGSASGGRDDVDQGDSTGSSRRNDVAVDEGPVGSTSRGRDDVARSDGGRDSKRKKPSRGPSPRRTRARR